MSRELIFLWQAVWVGVLIVFVYDGLRILRRVFLHKHFMISIEDFLFWLVCAVAVFLWMYRVSNGSLRWFAVAGALSGMFLYKKLFSEFIVTYTAKLISFLLHILGKILGFVFKPFRWLGRKIGLAGGKLQRRRRKVARKLNLWLKSGLKALIIRVRKQ